MNKINYIMPLFLLFAGCSPKGAAQSDTPKYTYSAAVIFSENMRQLDETLLPWTPQDYGRIVTVDVGKPLIKSLLKSVGKVYTEVVEVETLEDAEEYDRILKFTHIESPSFEAQDARLEEQYFYSAYYYLFHVEIEAIEEVNFMTVRNDIVTGRGRFSSFRIETTEERFKYALDGAIAQISDRITKLLREGFAEPGS